MKSYIFSTFLLITGMTLGQDYTSYFTGNQTDLMTNALGGVCLMGGATEDDEAMKWFLQQANGGDILVLRTSGSDGYNDYMYNSLGITVNSVETIVCNNAGASNDSYVQQKVENAEAIWFAGGDQWNYISYWRNTPIDSLINEGIENRNLVIGGTSAGMAIQGKYYFSAENGTVTSAAALADPYNMDMTVDSTAFISNAHLTEVITDTHYDDPDRKGRHVAFLARIFSDYGVVGKGIACDEYTAVCIGTDGIAHVYGGFPTYDDNAYFIQPNCGLTDFSPENCSSGNALNWNRGGEALKVYSIKGTSTGNNTFDLNSWETGTGGTWEDWYIDNGTLNETSGSPINCAQASLSNLETIKVDIYPNPTTSEVNISINNMSGIVHQVQISDLAGKTVKTSKINTTQASISVRQLTPGTYFLSVQNDSGNTYTERLVIQ